MHGTEAPSPWIQRWAHLIPSGTPVLDLACGAGRHMQHLASLGYPVLGVDHSEEALSVARQWGPTMLADIENGPWPLQNQHFGGVVVTHYLWRPLWQYITDSVAPGGALLYETFARGHETVGRPSRPDFLLAPGELLKVAAHAGLRVVAFEDGFATGPERFIQRIAAVRETASTTPPRWLLR